MFIVSCDKRLEMDYCELCKSREVKYTCPRCNIKYCSLDCYRSPNHSQCSEAFYKECVVSELQSQHGNVEDKKKVLEMIQRVETNEDEEWENLDSDDSAGSEDLHERLDGIDLNNADEVWEKLTKAEKEEFKSIIYNGEIDKIVEPIVPWWKQKLDSRPVVDIEEHSKKIKEVMEKSPPVLEIIKDFSKISTKKPANCIVYNIANILGTYCYIFRFYNGDHQSYALEATNNFISVCNNLKSNTNFEDLLSAVDTIIFNCHNFNLFADHQLKDTLVEDVCDIFNGPDSNSKEFLLSALSDVISLFECARHRYRERRASRKSSQKAGFSSEFSATNEESGSYPELKNQTHFTGCVKKLEFYLSFIQHCYNSNEWPLVTMF